MSIEKDRAVFRDPGGPPPEPTPSPRLQRAGFRRFGVDETLCIGCGLCETTAPENIRLAPGRSVSQVHKQPETAAEEAACTDASEFCPTGGLQPLD